MGQLKHNTSYIYESPDGGNTVYAREFGSDNRKLIGLLYPPSDGELDLNNHVLWNDIRQAAKTNPALQKAMENVIMLYRLSKDNPM